MRNVNDSNGTATTTPHDGDNAPRFPGIAGMLEFVRGGDLTTDIARRMRRLFDEGRADIGADDTPLQRMLWSGWQASELAGFKPGTRGSTLIAATVRGACEDAGVDLTPTPTDVATFTCFNAVFGRADAADAADAKNANDN